MIKFFLSSLYFLYSFFSFKRKTQFFGIIIFSVISSILEIISIASIIPFAEIVLNLDNGNILNKFFINNFNIEIDYIDNIFFITIIFIFFVILSGFVKMILLFLNTRFTEVCVADLSSNILFNELNKPFIKHLKRNTSEIISILTEKMSSVNTVISSILNFISSIIILFFMINLLIYFTPRTIIFLILVLCVFYLVLYLIILKIVAINSTLINEKQKKIVKIINESLNNFREIIISDLTKKYINIFNLDIYKLKRSQALIIIFASFPRYLLEILIIVGAAIFIYFIAINGYDINISIPTFAAFAFGIQKSLPYFQQCFSSLINVKGNFQSFESVRFFVGNKLTSLRNDFNNDKEIQLIGNLNLVIDKFFYDDSKKTIFENVNINFPLGSKIAIVGESGIGKSTLLDILMGFHVENNCKIKINDLRIDQNNIHNYHNRLSHMPQNVFIMDKTINENISLSNDKIVNYKKILEIGKNLEMDTFTKNLEDGYNSYIGENGIKISGGQKQRIGLARAMYKDSKIIFFDESTNSLDSLTENKIINYILNLPKDVTIFFSTHKKNFLSKFDFIIEIKNKNLNMIDLSKYKK